MSRSCGQDPGKHSVGPWVPVLTAAGTNCVRCGGIKRHTLFCLTVLRSGSRRTVSTWDLEPGVLPPLQAPNMAHLPRATQGPSSVPLGLWGLIEPYCPRLAASRGQGLPTSTRRPGLSRHKVQVTASVPGEQGLSEGTETRLRTPPKLSVVLRHCEFLSRGAPPPGHPVVRGQSGPQLRGVTDALGLHHEAGRLLIPPRSPTPMVLRSS